jgi:transmembrane sensor
MSSTFRSGASPSDAAAIEAAAAAWLSLRDRGMSPEETAEFVRWLQNDPGHATVFAELDAVWKDFDRLATLPVGNCAESDADLLAPRCRGRRGRTYRIASVTVVLAAAAAIAWMVHVSFRVGRTDVATAVGAFQKIDLPDGSVAQLNTNTAIAMAFTAGERRITMLRGEAFFAVKPDPQRPFIVTAGSVAVRAVGTAFNVRWRDADIEVLVAEGRVRLDDAKRNLSLMPTAPDLAAPILYAGDRARVSARQDRYEPQLRQAHVEKIGTPEVQRALAWQERRLEFDATPLGEAVREFNRYNHRQLLIADSELLRKRFSGSFRSDGYEAFVGLLERDFGVRATRREQEILLSLDR